MSNVITVVSSSPPPLDNSQPSSHDDDFGNFACASNIKTNNCDYTVESNFYVDWSHVPTSFSAMEPGSKENYSARGIASDPDGEMNSDTEESKTKSMKNSKSFPERDSGAAVCDNEDDSTAFQEVSCKKSKPQIEGLALQAVTKQAQETDEICCSEDTAPESALGQSHESVVTDSGVFSAGLSPVPSSESVSISDKIVQSEDEMCSDLPQDSQQEQQLTEPKSACSVNNPNIAAAEQNTDCICSDTLKDSFKEDEVVAVHDLDRSMPLTDMPKQTEQTDGFTSKDNDVSGADIAHSCTDSPLSSVLQQGNPENDYNQSGVEEEIEGILCTSDILSDEFAAGNSTENIVGVSDGSENTKDDNESVTQTNQDTLLAFRSEQTTSTSEGLEDRGVPVDDEWAAFQTSDFTPECGQSVCQSPFPTESEEHRSAEQDLFTDSMEQPEALKSSYSNPGQGGDEFGDFCSNSISFTSVDIPATCNQSVCAVSQDVNVKKDCMFTAVDKEAHCDKNILLQDETEELQDRSIRDKVPSDTSNDKDDVDFADFSSWGPKQDNWKQTQCDDFSSREVAQNNESDDDFGDFSSQPSPTVQASNSNFNALNSQTSNIWSEKTPDVNHDEEDFGDFSGQTTSTPAPAESGWANFEMSPKVDTGENDFGDFSETKVAEQIGGQGIPMPPASTDLIKAPQIEGLLCDCFPESSTSPSLVSEQMDNDDIDNDDLPSATSNKTPSGALEALLKHGIKHCSASQQTWEDHCVRLWSHLQDVDGSPAVTYQWAKSSTNSQLFRTLHIDTQNMLIGHKKPSVPIFATGLSLLEPVRSGGRERRIRAEESVTHDSVSSGKTSDTAEIKDCAQQNGPKSSQEVPAADFDWSTSGLTNPLTSNSLDLDFLGVQDSNINDESSVFRPELFDVPTSFVKFSLPFEDAVQNVEPSGQDCGTLSQDSPEAAEVLGGLPNLNFMQSKVLMFPINN